MPDDKDREHDAEEMDAEDARALIEEHERELESKHEHADNRTGLERRKGRDRRKEQKKFEGPDRRTGVGRRGRFDRRTMEPAFGYENPDDKKKK